MLCKAIVWDILGGNKKGEKLCGANYLKAIYPGDTIRVTIT